MVDKSQWVELTDANPNHSTWYIERFRSMAEAGDDLDGEARLVDAMAPRGARILDAGCGPGRVGGYLARAGHQVVGVDVDPVLIDAAAQEHPGPTWIVSDLAELDLSAHGITEGFDVIVSAGNVMTFLAPSTRKMVLANVHHHLAENGRLVIGFGAGRGYEFADFRSDAAEAGLVPSLELGTWDLRPSTAAADFLVCIMGRG